MRNLNRRFQTWKELQQTVLPPFLQVLIAALLLLPNLFFAGCATAPKKIEKPRSIEGDKIISAEILIESESKTFKAKAELFLKGSSTLRLDLLSTLDVPLATIVYAPEKVEYLIFKQKKYYSGVPNSHALDPLVPVSVNPLHLVQIIRQLEPTGSKCNQDNDTKSCDGVSNETAYSVKWYARSESGPWSGLAKKVALEIPNRNLKLKFILSTMSDPDPKWAHTALNLQVPAGFKSLPVPSEKRSIEF